MARGVPQALSRFAGGLNTEAGPYELRTDQSPDCSNVRSAGREGAIRKRAGIMDLGDGTNFDAQPRKLGVYRSGVTSRLIAFGTKVQVLSPGAALSAAHVASTTKPWLWWSVTGMNGPVFAQSDVEKLVYNGTTWATWSATSGTVPAGSVGCVHQNRLFVGDVTSLTDMRTGFAFSDPGDFRAWQVENVVKLDPWEHDRITGMCSFGDSLYVFKRGGVWRVYDSDYGSNVKLASDTGTAFRDSVVATDRGVIWLDPDRGVMRTSGGTPDLLSGAITSLLRNLPMDEEARFNVAAAYWGGSYWLSIPDANGRPSRLLEFDLDTRVWWSHDCAAYALAVAAFGQSGDPVLQRDTLVGAIPGSLLRDLDIAPDASSLRLFQMFRSRTFRDTVLGLPDARIAFRWRSAPVALNGNPHVSKRLSQLRVDAIGPGQISIVSDFAQVPRSAGALQGTTGSEPGGWATARPGNWCEQREDFRWTGRSAGLVNSRFFTLGKAREVQFQVSGTSTEVFELHSYCWFVGPRGRRD